MKFLILNTDYPEFLRWLYVQHPGLENQPYEERMRVHDKTEWNEKGGGRCSHANTQRACRAIAT